MPTRRCWRRSATPGRGSARPGRILTLLRAGRLPRPGAGGPGQAAASLLDLRPDAEGARLLARIGRAAFAGDDGLLAAIVRVLGRGRVPRTSARTKS